MLYADVLAGYSVVSGTIVAANPDAQIGNVTVDHDWIASNLVAGVANSASGNTAFGDSHDTLISGTNSPAIIARIGTVTIGGQAQGIPGDTTGHFGIVAQQVGTLKIGPVTHAAATTAQMLALGATGDFTEHTI
jgi:hypothetical protein